jgi:hypothetical protein
MDKDQDPSIIHHRQNHLGSRNRIIYASVQLALRVTLFCNDVMPIAQVLYTFQTKIGWSNGQVSTEHNIALVPYDD